jgi:hypothetical protein
MDTVFPPHFPLTSYVIFAESATTSIFERVACCLSHNNLLDWIIYTLHAKKVPFTIMLPIAAPPAAPPPPPPPSDYSDNQSIRSSNLSEASPYQTATKGSNKNIFPVITNYGLSPQHHFYASNGNEIHSSYQDHDPNESEHNRIHRSKGDVNLRPNTGNTNQESGVLIPGSLREIASSLRWMTIVTTVTAILWEGFALPMRIITGILEPSKLVLGMYLGVFCILLLGVELKTSFSPRLRDNFGFLYNPMTRGFVLVIMSSMCFSLLKSWWECVLGVAFFIVGVGYIYTYVKYSEYRRWQDYNENAMTASWQDVRQYWMRSEHGNGRLSSVWADPEGAWNTVKQTTTAIDEARSLLHNV